ncbi:hypothetical protein INT80_11380 [Gallibacterium anatis]|uniref:Uncharacterized protein n=1 Tax=Gallibacterium anatis TaxID=750 RepID=A0A930UY64_9PAST|nr:hypothetical protein [Gallibacterium anatis]
MSGNGNSVNNKLLGNQGHNRLMGYAGNDTLKDEKEMIFYLVVKAMIPLCLLVVTVLM